MYDNYEVKICLGSSVVALRQFDTEEEAREFMDKVYVDDLNLSDEVLDENQTDILWLYLFDFNGNLMLSQINTEKRN